MRRLLNFIPNFGPIIAAIPAVLIAFLQGPQQALFVALLYVVLQMFDGYVLTRLLTGTASNFHPCGSPLTAAVMLLVTMLYIEDVLGEPTMRERIAGERDVKAQRRESRSGSKLKEAKRLDAELRSAHAVIEIKTRYNDGVTAMGYWLMKSVRTNGTTRKAPEAASSGGNRVI